MAPSGSIESRVNRAVRPTLTFVNQAPATKGRSASSLCSTIKPRRSGLACDPGRWIGLLIGLIFWTGCGQGSGPATRSSYYDGVGYLENAKYDEAITSLTDAIRENPMDARASLRLADALQKNARPSESLAAYTDAIRIDRELTKANELPEAKRSEAIKRGVPLGSWLIDTYLGRGAVYGDLGKADDALKDFAEAIRIDPDSAEGHFRRGTTFLAKGFPDVALDDLTATIQLAPNHIEARYQRARASLLLSDYSQAIHDCQCVIRLDAKKASAYQVLAAAYSAFTPPDYAKAITCYKEAEMLDRGLASDIHDKLASIYFRLGVSLEGEKKQIEAEDAFRQAIRLDPQYDTRIKEYRAKKDHTGKIVTAQMPTRPDPKVSDLNEKGAIALEQRRWDDAIRYYGEACQIDPEYADSHYGRGVAFLGKGFPDTALEELNRVIFSRKDAEAYAKNADAYCQRARAFILLKRYQRAVTDATEAIRLNPRLAEAYYYRGIAYLDDSDFDRAVVDLNEARSLNPGFGSLVKRPLAAAQRRREL